MKLLTINLHGAQEQYNEMKLKKIANFIDENEVDIIFLQEVNQTIFTQNTALLINYMLKNKYYFELTSTHNGFCDGDECLAILSKRPIESTFSKVISKEKNRESWQRRKFLCVEIDEINYCCTHTTWDAFIEEPFNDQIDEIASYLNNKKFVIAGDFNVDPQRDNKCYDYLLNKLNAKDISNGIDYTFPTYDTPGEDNTKIKIDYILTNLEYKNYNVHKVFTKAIVSDHYGIFVEVEF